VTEVNDTSHDGASEFGLTRFEIVI